MHTHGIIALQISIQTLVIYQEKAIRSNTNENISCIQYRIAHPRIVHYLYLAFECKVHNDGINASPIPNKTLGKFV